jgi:hypothetical protein
MPSRRDRADLRNHAFFENPYARGQPKIAQDTPMSPTIRFVKTSWQQVMPDLWLLAVPPTGFKTRYKLSHLYSHKSFPLSTIIIGVFTTFDKGNTPSRRELQQFITILNKVFVVQE